MNALKVMLKCYQMRVKASFQNRVDAWLCTIGVFFREATSIMVIYFTLIKFDYINGWNIEEMMFLFSLLFLTYSIVVVLFADLRNFSYFVNMGKFDRIMLTPRGLLIQLISNNSDVVASLGHGLLGIVLFIMSANKVGITWNIEVIVYYVAAVAGGVLLQGGIFIIISCFAFRFIETESLREVFYWNVRRFAGYPISIYHKAIQMLMIYVVPFAFVNYFPAQFLLRKADMAAYPIVYLYIAPLVGVVVYLIAYIFWRYSVKYYTSTGN